MEKYDDKLKEKVIQFYNLNRTMGLKKIGKQFDISEGTVRRWVDPEYDKKEKQRNYEYKKKRKKTDTTFANKLKETAYKCTDKYIKEKYASDEEFVMQHKKRCKEYRDARPAEMKRIRKEWYSKNKKHKKMLDKKYQEKNKERLMEKRKEICFPNQQWRFTKQYEDWRKTVYERDLHTCQQCQKQNCKLNAHHIKDGINYPELRYIVENGITLCEKCHKKEHHS